MSQRRRKSRIHDPNAISELNARSEKSQRPGKPKLVVGRIIQLYGDSSSSHDKL